MIHSLFKVERAQPILTAKQRDETFPLPSLCHRLLGQRLNPAQMTVRGFLANVREDGLSEQPHKTGSHF